MPLTATDAQTFLDENFAAWVRAPDLTVTNISPTGAVLTMPITQDLARAEGNISRQALTAMANTSMVLACGDHFSEMKPVATTNLDTQFLGPGTGESIRCDAEIARAGRALIFARATKTALPSGKPVATANATFFAS